MKAGPGFTWRRVADSLRSLDRMVRSEREAHGAWVWAVPLSAFVLCVTILVVAGVLSGVWAAEYIPVALVEGLVISGLFVVCFTERDQRENDHGDGGPGPDPSRNPPPFDPTVWLPLFAEIGHDPLGDRDPARAQREAVGASR